MRHRLGYRKLNRGPSERKALLRGLATQLVEYGRLETTLERAKELRGIVEPLVTMARVDNVSSRRAAASYLYKKSAVQRLFSEVCPANATRPGGYTRIVKLGFRPGDRARRVLIEFVEGSLVGDAGVAPRPAASTSEAQGSESSVGSADSVEAQKVND